MTFKHFVITRFNISLVSGPPEFEQKGYSLRYSPEWLEERVKYLEKVCAPTIKNQTNKNFEWLVLFGEWTPPEVMLELRRKHGFTPIMGPHHQLNELLDIAVRVGSPYIMTTNVDSDDGISVDFVNQVQNRFEKKNMAIYVDNGIRWHLNDDTYVSAKSGHNPFHTIVEKVEDGPVRTVQAHIHGNKGDYGPVIHIDNKTTRWLMGIHGGNLCNRITLKSEDKLKPFAEVSNLFGL